MTFRVDLRTSVDANPTRKDGTPCVRSAEGWYEDARNPIEAASAEEAQAQIDAELLPMKLFGYVPTDTEARVVPLNDEVLEAELIG